MALLVRAARLVGPRDRGGRLLLQTFVPRDDVIQAALLADPARAAEADLARRRLLALPPFGALAEIAGSGSDEFVAGLPVDPDVAVVATDRGHLARAADWLALGAHLRRGERPPGSRLRIAVDPPR